MFQANGRAKCHVVKRYCVLHWSQQTRSCSCWSTTTRSEGKRNSPVCGATFLQGHRVFIARVMGRGTLRCQYAKVSQSCAMIFTPDEFECMKELRIRKKNVQRV